MTNVLFLVVMVIAFAITAFGTYRRDAGIIGVGALVAFGDLILWVWKP
jgi:hypothetical protein